MTVVRGVWITWNRQRRNRSLAKAFGMPLFEFEFEHAPVLRYPIAFFRTLAVLITRRPDVIVVQNPSLLLTLFAILYGKATGRPIVVDAHNAALGPLTHAGGMARGVFARLAAFAVRQPALTLVSNENLKKLVDGRGGRGFVLPDPVPDLSATPQRRDLKGRHQVLLVCTYADDEPYASVIEAARMLEPDVVIYVTGDYRRARHLPAAVPSNVVLTGFLDEDDYVALLRAVQVVVDLTDREDCLVCGAYEGIAAGRPLVLSGSAATRAYFSRGVCYTDNTPADLARQIRFAIDHRDRLEADVAVLKGELDTLFNRRWTSLQDVIGTLGTRVPALDC